MLKDLIKKIVSGTKKVVTLPARQSSGEFLLKKTDFGLVRVDYVVIQKIAERALAQIKEIQEASLSVDKFTGTLMPIKIRLTAVLAEGYSAPKASQAAYQAINDALRKFLLLEFYVPVDVKVKQIAQVIPQKRKRVR